MFLPVVLSITEVFLPVFYVATTALYGVSFIRGSALAGAWKSRFLLATVGLHVVAIGAHTATFGRCMVTTPFEVMSLVAFTLTATYAIVEFTTSVKGTGFFLTAFAACFELVSAVMTKLPSDHIVSAALRNPGIGLHVTFAVFGFGGIAIGAVYGVLYLLLYRELKRGRINAFYRNLPSLEALERLCTVAVAVGFSFLTVAIGIGAFWLPRVFSAFSYTDPKLIATGLIWTIYLCVLVAKYVVRLDGRRVIALSLGGFVIALFSMTIVNAVFSGFHRFF
jgi:ABC-type uncharacterized transport system permease subunit